MKQLDTIQNNEFVPVKTDFENCVRVTNTIPEASSENFGETYYLAKVQTGYTRTHFYKCCREEVDDGEGGKKWSYYWDDLNVGRFGVGDCSGLSLSKITSNDKFTAYISWTDPDDRTLGDQVIATWEKTILVWSDTHVPTSVTDGIGFLESSIRNQYASNVYVVSSLLTEKTYYFKLFPVSTDGYVTNSAFNVLMSTTNYLITSDAEPVLGKVYYTRDENAADLDSAYVSTVWNEAPESNPFAQSTVYYEKHDAEMAWGDIQRIIRNGSAPQVFNIGDVIFLPWHSEYGNLECLVVDFDHVTLADQSLTHSMTIQPRYLLSSEPAGDSGWAFDAEENTYLVQTQDDYFKHYSASDNDKIYFMKLMLNNSTVANVTSLDSSHYQSKSFRKVDLTSDTVDQSGVYYFYSYATGSTGMRPIINRGCETGNFVAGKNYFRLTDTEWKQATNISAGTAIPYGTYYERESGNSGNYVITQDTVFAANKTYYYKGGSNSKYVKIVNPTIGQPVAGANNENAGVVYAFPFTSDETFVAGHVYFRFINDEFVRFDDWHEGDTVTANTYYDLSAGLTASVWNDPNNSNRLPSHSDIVTPTGRVALGPNGWPVWAYKKSQNDPVTVVPLELYKVVYNGSTYNGDPIELKITEPITVQTAQGAVLTADTHFTAGHRYWRYDGDAKQYVEYTNFPVGEEIPAGQYYDCTIPDELVGNLFEADLPSNPAVLPEVQTNKSWPNAIYSIKGSSYIKRIGGVDTFDATTACDGAQTLMSQFVNISDGQCALWKINYDNCTNNATNVSGISYTRIYDTVNSQYSAYCNYYSFSMWMRERSFSQNDFTDKFTIHSRTCTKELRDIYNAMKANGVLVRKMNQFENYWGYHLTADTFIRPVYDAANSVVGTKEYYELDPDHTFFNLTSDTAFASGKVYYTRGSNGTFSVANITSSTTFAAGTYFERNYYRYGLTSDERFQGDKTYYTKTNTYYAADTGIGAMYELASSAYPGETTYRSTVKYYRLVSGKYQVIGNTNNGETISDIGTVYIRKVEPNKYYELNGGTYSLTSDTVFAANKTYYIVIGSDYALANVTVGDVIGNGTYYERYTDGMRPIVWKTWADLVAEAPSGTTPKLYIRNSDGSYVEWNGTLYRKRYATDYGYIRKYYDTVSGSYNNVKLPWHEEENCNYVYIGHYQGSDKTVESTVSSTAVPTGSGATAKYFDADSLLFAWNHRSPNDPSIDGTSQAPLDMTEYDPGEAYFVELRPRGRYGQGQATKNGCDTGTAFTSELYWFDATSSVYRRFYNTKPSYTSTNGGISNGMIPSRIAMTETTYSLPTMKRTSSTAQSDTADSGSTFTANANMVYDRNCMHFAVISGASGAYSTDRSNGNNTWAESNVRMYLNGEYDPTDPYVGFSYKQWWTPQNLWDKLAATYSCSPVRSSFMAGFFNYLHDYCPTRDITTKASGEENTANNQAVRYYFRQVDTAGNPVFVPATTTYRNTRINGVKPSTNPAWSAKYWQKINDPNGEGIASEVYSPTTHRTFKNGVTYFTYDAANGQYTVATVTVGDTVPENTYYTMKSGLPGNLVDAVQFAAIIQPVVNINAVYRCDNHPRMPSQTIDLISLPSLRQVDPSYGPNGQTGWELLENPSTLDYYNTTSTELTTRRTKQFWRNGIRPTGGIAGSAGNWWLRSAGQHKWKTSWVSGYYYPGYGEVRKDGKPSDDYTNGGWYLPPGLSPLITLG